MAKKKKKNQKNSENRIYTGIITLLLIIIIVISNVKNSSALENNNNLSTSNSDYQTASIATIENNSQYVEINVLPGSYAPIIVQKGIPVKFNIKAESSNLTGCNNGIKIKEYGLDIKLNAGDNIVEFTPNETGTFTYTCWMGMLSSTITVVDDLSNVNSEVVNSINETQKSNTGATCGGSGGCGCGGGN